MKYLKYFFAGLLALLGAGVAVASVTFTTSTQPVDTYKNFTFLSATTTGGVENYATSTNLVGGGGYFIISGAKKVELYFSHGGVSTTSIATSTFAIQVSPDAINWYDYKKLLTGTSTTVVSTVSIEGATSTVHAVMADYLYNTFYAIRCIASGGGAKGTQGEHTCRASAEF